MAKMTQEEAIAEAAKREKHKPKTLTHKSWRAVHSSEKGWHTALVDTYQTVVARARQAGKSGDLRAFMNESYNAIMMKIQEDLDYREPND
jgi:hypothetical protein